jgi:hypothetical protein
MEGIAEELWKKISANWHKSSGSNGETCVEVGKVVVRDTTDRAGALLAVSADAWRALLAEVRAS